jgi:hypothetical protein
VRVAAAAAELAALLTAMLAASHAAAAFAAATPARAAPTRAVGHAGAEAAAANAGTAAAPRRVQALARGCRRGLAVLLQVALLATAFALAVALLGANASNRDSTGKPSSTSVEPSSISSGLVGFTSGGSARSPLHVHNDAEVLHMEAAVAMARLWGPRFVCASAAAQLLFLLG